MMNGLIESQIAYRRFLIESINIFQSMNEKSPCNLFKVIIAQMDDILKNVVEERVITNWFDIDERYSLGAIAVKEFPNNSDLQERLCEVFIGALEFNGPLTELFED